MVNLLEPQPLLTSLEVMVVATIVAMGVPAQEAMDHMDNLPAAMVDPQVPVLVATDNNSLVAMAAITVAAVVEVMAIMTEAVVVVMAATLEAMVEAAAVATVSYVFY